MYIYTFSGLFLWPYHLSPYAMSYCLLEDCPRRVCYRWYIYTRSEPVRCSSSVDELDVPPKVSAGESSAPNMDDRIDIAVVSNDSTVVGAGGLYSSISTVVYYWLGWSVYDHTTGVDLLLYIIKRENSPMQILQILQIISLKKIV